MSPDTKAVPAIPPISTISDPNTRAVLQALVNGWQMRNGQTGDGSRKFLTEADVGMTVNNYFSSVANGSQSGSTPPPGDAGKLVDAVTQMVLGSREWAALNERIQIIQTPDWLRQAMSAALEKEMTELRALTAKVGQALAGIGYQDTARTTLERSIVESFKTLVAQYGISTTGINSVQRAVATYAAANALHISQIYATVDGAREVAIEEASEVRADIDGTLSGLYTLKVDAAGHVAGMAIGVTSDSAGFTTSNIVFKADSFAIGGVGGSTAVPFIVKTTTWADGSGLTHPPGVYMKDAKITNANIDNLTLGFGQVTGALSDNVTSPWLSNWYIGRNGSVDTGGGSYYRFKTSGRGVDVSSTGVLITGPGGSNLSVYGDVGMAAAGAELVVGPGGSNAIWIEGSTLKFTASSVNMDATTKAAFLAALGL